MHHTLLKVLYPPKCILCRKPLRDGKAYFCHTCYQKYKDEISLRMQVMYKDTAALILAALDKIQEEEMPMILGVFPLFPYVNEYRKAIIRWKYTGIRKYARGFAELAVKELNLLELLAIDAIVPVPIAPSRMRKRGFNQALDFAEAISDLTGIQVMDCLVRNRETRPQASCNLEERYANIKGSISCEIDKDKIKKNISNVLIVDDIYTTGSTVKECCKALKTWECFKDIKVYILVIAKGEI